MELEKRIEKALDKLNDPRDKNDVLYLYEKGLIGLIEDRDHNKLFYIDKDSKISFRGFGI